MEHPRTMNLRYSLIYFLNCNFFLFNLGTPPDCNLCIEPCYNNWNSYISQEGTTIANLMANTSALLALFGSTPYSQTNTQLQILNDNLTYASTVYEGAQYDTRSKETQFRQVWGVCLRRSNSVLLVPFLVGKSTGRASFYRIFFALYQLDLRLGSH